MVTGRPGAFKWAIDRLPSDKFQVLCHYFLRDRGFQSNLGVLPGIDKAHDLYGTDGSGRSFTGHCTTQKKGLPRKIRDDFLAGARNDLDSASLPVKLLSFSLGRPFSSPAAEDKFRNRILSDLEAIDSRYLTAQPEITFFSSDQLAHEIDSLGEQSSAFLTRWLSGVILTDSDVGYLKVPEPERGKATPFDDFRLALREISPSLSRSERIPRILTVIHFCSSRLWYSVRLSLEAQTADCTDPAISFLVTTVSNISIGKDPDAKGISSFLKHAIDIHGDLAEVSRIHFVLTSQLIRRLIYSGHEGISILAKELETLLKIDEDFWAVFTADLYLRYICGYIRLPPELVGEVSRISTNFFKSQPRAPLAQLGRFLVDPVASARQAEWPRMSAQLKGVAKSCRSLVDARWFLTTCMRVLPLYEITTEEGEFAGTALELLDCLPFDLAQRSPQIVFKKLSFCLRGFMYSEDVGLLRKFEDRFLASKVNMSASDVACLQVEYAACLIALLTSGNDYQQDRLRFFSSLETGRNPLDSALMGNDRIVPMSLKWPGLSAADRKGVLRWLNAYARALYGVSLSEQILENPLVVLNYPATCRVYSIRPSIGYGVAKSLREVLEAGSIASQNFYARATSLFRLIDRESNLDLLLEYVFRALDGTDKYCLARNANGILWTLYSVGWYGDDEQRARAQLLARKVAREVLDAPAAAPQPYWAYLGGIEFRERPQERLFVDALGKELSELDRLVDCRRLALQERVNESRLLVFSDSLLELLSREAANGSLFAAGLRTDIQNAEIWNLIATTIINCSETIARVDLLLVARIYSVARCFARANRRDEQKYSYNYIWRMSEALLLADEVDRSFLAEAARYLSRPEARMFAHKEKCVESFFTLLLRDFASLNREVQSKIARVLRGTNWICDAFGGQVETIYQIDADSISSTGRVP